MNCISIWNRNCDVFAFCLCFCQKVWHLVVWYHIGLQCYVCNVCRNIWHWCGMAERWENAWAWQNGFKTGIRDHYKPPDVIYFTKTQKYIISFSIIFILDIYKLILNFIDIDDSFGYLKILFKKYMKILRDFN